MDTTVGIDHTVSGIRRHARGSHVMVAASQVWSPIVAVVPERSLRDEDTQACLEEVLLKDLVGNHHGFLVEPAQLPAQLNPRKARGIDVPALEGDTAFRIRFLLALGVEGELIRPLQRLFPYDLGKFGQPAHQVSDLAGRPLGQRAGTNLGRKLRR